MAVFMALLIEHWTCNPKGCGFEVQLWWLHFMWQEYGPEPQF